jgi:hypothetical protein
MKNDKNEFEDQWEQWPPIEGDHEHDGSSFMLGLVTIGTILFWGVVLFF